MLGFGLGTERAKSRGCIALNPTYDFTRELIRPAMAVQHDKYQYKSPSKMVFARCILHLDHCLQ